LALFFLCAAQDQSWSIDIANRSNIQSTPDYRHQPRRNMHDRVRSQTCGLWEGLRPSDLSPNELVPSIEKQKDSQRAMRAQLRLDENCRDAAIQRL